MTVDNGATTHVEGTALDMKVTWNGAERIRCKWSNQRQQWKEETIAFKFGGNLEMAKK